MEKRSSSLARLQLLDKYREEVRATDTDLVRQYYDALLAERKLRDPDYVNTVCQSLCAGAAACGEAKEDWDLDLAMSNTGALIADYWLEPPRRALMLRVRARDPALQTVDLSFTGVDADILGELLPVLAGSAVTKLNLAGNGALCDDAAELIGSVLFGPPPATPDTLVSYLDLSSCGIGAGGVAALARAAADQPQLTHVLLHGTPAARDVPEEVERLQRVLSLNMVGSCTARLSAD
eukprot:TRINITY_DN20169_c0_g1_i1.p1 TRINITY_DN20169_c0_g1~~TRINITY_DN20169_c0_g1_i1.p1  ORF type:complete len:236 (+),score=86.16 TRINITY_DN20169_c0_g1_i1:85-792(+)